MKEYIEERALAVAGYIIESNATVRQAARQFGISKSTVHKDITERLMQVNPQLLHVLSSSIRSFYLPKIRL